MFTFVSSIIWFCFTQTFRTAAGRSAKSPGNYASHFDTLSREWVIIVLGCTASSNGVLAGPSRAAPDPQVTLTIAVAIEGFPVPDGGACARVRVAHLGFFHG
jgi:hypothetical protein